MRWWTLVRRCVQAEDRYDFFLIAPDGRMIGESVINEIDWALRCGNFRIVIFHERDCGKGLGGFMTAAVRDFAFGTLGLHRLELDVFSFNPRAEQTYLRAGFRREGVLREAVRDGDGYGDDILMAMLETDWQAFKQKNVKDRTLLGMRSSVYLGPLALGTGMCGDRKTSLAGWAQGGLNYSSSGTLR